MRSRILVLLALTAAVACGRTSIADDPILAAGGGGEGGEGGAGQGGDGPGGAGQGGDGPGGAGQGGAGCGAPEACNAIDDDCDGAVDEGDPGGGAGCDTGLAGVCAAGLTSCEGGALACSATALPAPEVCNGADDDCNGAVDDGAKLCHCTHASSLGHTYFLCDTPSTWQDAHDVCADAGTHLVTITSKTEDDFVFDAANAVSHEKWWIGLDDIALEGVFFWDDGSAVTYEGWAANEPNDSGGGEDCGQINRFYPEQGWNDEPCDTGLFFICETP